MNFINLGYFKGKALHLIGCKYVNGTIALILLNNNIEYETVTYYVREIQFKQEGYILLNPNMSDELKKFLIRKNI